MAAYTTTQTGDWSVAATWGGTGPPGTGDTATLDHAVTVDANTTVGSSPGDSNTIVLQINADLTIAAGVTFTVKGNVSQTNEIDADVGAGGGIIFDASGATPTSSEYIWTIGTAHNPASPGRISFNGTSGSRCFAQSDAGGGNGRFASGGFLRGGMFQATYTDFDALGTSAIACIEPYLSSSTCPDFSITHCSFDSCGFVGKNLAMHVDSTFIFDDNNYQNPLDGNSLYINGYKTQPLNTGTRSVQRNYIEGPIIQYFTDFTIDDNVLSSVGSCWSNIAEHTPASFAGNLVVTESKNGHNTQFDTLDNYFLMNTTDSNPHYIVVPQESNTGGLTTTHDGWIFECAGTSASGDCFIPDTGPSVAYTLLIKNCIVLPNAAGDQSGTLMSSIGNQYLTAQFEHNTYCVEGSATGYATGVSVGETYAGHAGLVSILKSNLAWAVTSGDGALIAEEPTAPVDDILTAAGADYNCTYLAGGGYSQGGYEVSFATAVYETDYAANDVDVDPGFMDETRDCAAWDSELGGAGTIANMLTEFAKMNLATWDTAYTPAALHTWVKAGFAPTNASLAGAAHDAGTIGAVEYAGAPTDRTVTVKSSGGDYASLNSALSTEAANLVSLDRRLIIDCYDMEDTTPVVLPAGYTTSATRYILIKANGNHNGAWNTGVYRLVAPATAGNGVIELDQAQAIHVHMRGLQISENGSTDDVYGVHAESTITGGWVKIEKCIFMGDHGDADTTVQAIRNESPATVTAWNNIIYNWARGIHSADASSPIESHNNTIDDVTHAFGYGAASGTSIEAINTRATALATGVLATSGGDGLTTASNYNLTDGTAPTNWGANSLDSTDTPTVDYVDDSNATLTSRDYHLGATDSGIGAGDNLSTSFTDDIDGDTRG